MKLKWYGKEVTAAMKKGAAEGLFDGINFMRDEMDKIVPHDEGTLERSGDTKVDNSALKAATGYDTPYAIRLHEHPEYNFQDGREGKWVEKVIKDASIKKDVLNHIGKKIKKAMK
ncbi:hypothetical protein [Halocella sp. SP3-1]|uniref:hypothetical protein n=1 Tax=Halocella sp. SP3-1 TaxID=2382161 RepID=UPI000F760026|nr:hypothetical protein [Halocella sp. SP3-1]AZO95279.1 hypothetical protein D7D81_12130 [Halocella sp. SP3-1]